jgi:hypothetical protein
MKKAILCIAFFSITIILMAQNQPVKTSGKAPLKSKMNFADSTLKDYDPKIMNISESPLPSAEYGNKKQILNKRRAELKKKSIINVGSERIKSTLPAPNLIKGFTANTGNSVPLDNDIAVSNGGFVISVVNSNIRCYDDTGTLIFSKSLKTLDSVIQTFTYISDPRIIYDPIKDRFILVCFTGNLSTTNKIIVGFSSTNDPSNDWNFYLLNGNSFNDSTWSDYPIIAINNSDLFITFNQVKDNVNWQVGFKQSVIWQIDKEKGYNADTLKYDLWSNLNLNGKNYRNICPAKYQDTPMPDDMYFVSLRNVDLSNDSIFLFHITNSYKSGNAQITSKVLKSNNPYGFPPNPKQKNGQYLMTNDGRILAAINYDNNIYFGANSVNPTYLNAGVYLGTVKNVNTTPSVTGQVFSSNTMEYGYPSMAAVGIKSSYGIIYNINHIVSDSFAGVSTLYQDMNGKFSSLIRIKDGNSSINVLTDSTERWGDYSGIQRKYNDPCLAYSAGTYIFGSNLRTWVQMSKSCNINAGIFSENRKLFHTEIYPNPASERFIVEFEMTEKKWLSFYLQSIDGKFSKLLLMHACKAGTNRFSISTDDLSNGIYILQAITNTGENIFAKKIVIAK